MKKEKRTRLKLTPEILRQRLEFLTLIVIFACSLSVLVLNFQTKTSLVLDEGNIKYTGYVVNHRMNGQGKLTYKNGDIYEGNFVNGTFSGQGKFIAKAGWTYEGHFKNGQADGQGTLITETKAVYKGTFKQGIYQK